MSESGSCQAQRRPFRRYDRCHFPSVPVASVTSEQMRDANPQLACAREGAIRQRGGSVERPENSWRSSTSSLKVTRAEEILAPLKTRPIVSGSDRFSHRCSGPHVHLRRGKILRAAPSSLPRPVSPGSTRRRRRVLPRLNSCKALGFARFSSGSLSWLSFRTSRLRSCSGSA